MNENHKPLDEVGKPPFSAHDFRSFGLSKIAYIRAVTQGNDTAYTIHAADGKTLATEESYMRAQAIILQNDLIPVALH